MTETTTWEDRLFGRRQAEQTGTPLPQTPFGGQIHPWASAALDAWVDIVATSGEGERDSNLNKAAHRMGKIIGGGTIDLETVRSALAAAGRQCGQPTHEIERALRLDVTGGLVTGQANPVYPPERVDTTSPVTVLNGVPQTDTTEDDQTAATFARHVAVEAHQLRVREAARELVTAERAGTMPPFDVGSLNEILARPPEPPFRVEDLIPSQAGTLVVAPRKAGKTTFELNLARCLLTGEAFLGRFKLQPITGSVVMLNYEVSAAQLARWAADVGVPGDRLHLVNLRGRRNPLGLKEDKAALAETICAVDGEALIVDPFGRAFTGGSQNDNGDVGAWLSDLDRFARGECGIADVILAVHAGWEGERSRGASALEDWADTIITLTRKKVDDDGARYMKAIGRDVEVEEDLLAYDHHTRMLAMTGSGSRQNASSVACVPAVISYVSSNPECSKSGIENALVEDGMLRQDVRRAVDNLVASGHIRRYQRAGKGGGYAHLIPVFANPAEPRQSSPGEVTVTAPTPLGVGAVTTEFDEPRPPENPARLEGWSE